MMLRRFFPILAVTLVATAAQWAFAIDRAATPWVVVSMGVASAVAIAIGVVALRDEADLAEQWAPRWGDLRNGFLVAVLAWAAATGGARLLGGDGAFDAKLLRLYLQVGPVGPQPPVSFVAGIVVVAALEETLWRALVPRALAAYVPARVAWMLSAVLYAIAHMPAAKAMAVFGSANFLLPQAALGLGLALGGVAAAFGRVVPGFVAHVLFDLAILGPFALVRLSP
jgi:membrane protease YdiL (CAAX protease family)